MSYALRLSDDELARYRMMALRARNRETDLWKRAGIIRGARVADVGCGPGAMTVALAEVVGPGGYVVGIDADEQAVGEANSALAAVGARHAEARVGKADDTGLAPASLDAVMMRHVLAHNGPNEQRIVNHLGGLVRPGGHVYLLDVDANDSSISPLGGDAEDLQERYVRWHHLRGNDLRVGRRLGDLGRAAGLVIEELHEWFEVLEAPPGVRGPAWAARQALVADGMATEADLTRWNRAFTQLDERVERPRFTVATFAAVLRRPLEAS